MSKENPPSDPRILAVRVMLKSGNINKFDQIFRYMPPTPLARALGVGPERFSKCMRQPKHFTLEEIYNIADYFEYDRTKLLNMIHSVSNK